MSRPQLSRRLLRHISYNALRSESHHVQLPFPLSSRCLYLKPLERQNVFARSFIFGRKTTTRTAKPALYEPGYETLLDLEERQRAGIRPPSPSDVADATEKFLRHCRRGGYVQAAKIETLSAAYDYLMTQTNDNVRRRIQAGNLIGGLINVLRQAPPGGYRSEAHVMFMEKLLKDETICGEDGSPTLDMAYMDVLASYGQALRAREIAVQRWPLLLAASKSDEEKDQLRQAQRKSWLRIVRGITQDSEDKDISAQLETTIKLMEADGVPFDWTVHSKIISTFARGKQDLAATRFWYDRVPVGQGKPTAESTLLALNLCMKKQEFIWGDMLLKSLLEAHPGDKRSWDMVICWAAAKGRGVDEVAKVFEFVKQRTTPHPHLMPDISTINALIELANARGDAYTAERYLNLGKELGFRPNDETYLLQLDYRIDVNDLSGAMAAYHSLQAEAVSDDKDVSYMNRLIVALCSGPESNLKDVMLLVEELSARKAAFTPQVVASLTKLHLQRREIEDATDLLNTHALKFSAEDRQLVSQVVSSHIINSATKTSSAWETYDLYLKIFHDAPRSTFAQIMESFFARSRPDLATHVFTHMRRQPDSSELRPDIATYTACLSGIAVHADKTSLTTIQNMLNLDNAIEPDTKLKTAFMHAYTSCNEPSRTLNLWDDIIHSREGPSYTTIRVALLACAKLPDGHQTAEAIWTRTRNAGVAVTKEIHAAYAFALAASNMFDACTAICHDVGSRYSLAVTPLLLGSIFNGTPTRPGKRAFQAWAQEHYPDIYQRLQTECRLMELVRDESNGIDIEELVNRTGGEEVVYDLEPVGGNIVL